MQNLKEALKIATAIGLAMFLVNFIVNLVQYGLSIFMFAVVGGLMLSAIFTITTGLLGGYIYLKFFKK